MSSGARCDSPPRLESNHSAHSRGGGKTSSSSHVRHYRRHPEDEGRRKRPEVEHYKPPGAKKDPNKSCCSEGPPKAGKSNDSASLHSSSSTLQASDSLSKSKKRGGRHKEKAPPRGKAASSEATSSSSNGGGPSALLTSKTTEEEASSLANGGEPLPSNERGSLQRKKRPPKEDRRHKPRGEKQPNPRNNRSEPNNHNNNAGSHRKESNAEPSIKKEEGLIERISDWSLEIELEDERKRREKQKKITQPSPKNSGGIIRIPPENNSNGWRNSSTQSMNGRSSKSSKRNHHSSAGGTRGGEGVGKRDSYSPLQAPVSGSYAGSNSHAPLNPGSNLLPHAPLDSRLPLHPSPSSPNYPHHPASHPIPYGLLSLRPNGPEWYDVFNSRIYGPNDKHDINNISLIVRSDLRIFEITMQGSWELLSRLWDTQIAECRSNILRAFTELLVSDLVFVLKHNVEFHIWKIAFWNLTEVLKILLQKEESPQTRAVIKARISGLIDEGILFYEGALKLLQETYDLSLESYYNDILKPRPSDKFQRCVLGSAQNCLLCLGDLARYKELLGESSNLSGPRSYYLKASALETRNAKPFHMLAILSNMGKRKLDAIYYHMRCLTCKNAFRTEQQSLTLIFEEFKKAWEGLQREKILERERKRLPRGPQRDGHLMKGTRLRNEIWIRGDGGRRLHRTTSARESESIEEDELELMDMSSGDLCKRFITTFIYLLGKLFTYIDMDSFPLALEILAKELRFLLSRSPLPIDARSLVQIMAMNMFIIEHTKMKSGDTQSYRSSMQNAALQLSFEMFGILVERVNAIYSRKLPQFLSGELPLIAEESLKILLPPVKVWCDWMLGNNDTWYPVVSEEPFNQLAALATSLERLKPCLRPALNSFVLEEKASQDSHSLVKLPEDAILCGLGPWFRGLDWGSYRRYFPKDFPYQLAFEVRRLDAINFCVEFLEGLESPILKWSPPDNAHISLVENNEPSSAVDKVNAKLHNMLASQADILEESYSEEEDDNEVRRKGEDEAFRPLEEEGNEEIRALKHRKNLLERQHIAQEREMSKMQKKILSDHVSVTLEVRPHYIVPDTNCFVDHLEGIQALISSAKSTGGGYHLRVPLVVLNELDGLSKGGSGKYDSPAHASMVAENARKALAFLRSRPVNSKCVTARGTLLSSFNVTSEEDPGSGAAKNNDDLILGVCLNLSSNKQEESVIRGRNMRIVLRDVVLLTDDRNLKLKAHITDIPVNKFIDFFNWARLSPT